MYCDRLRLSSFQKAYQYGPWGQAAQSLPQRTVWVRRDQGTSPDAGSGEGLGLDEIADEEPPPSGRLS